MGHSHPAPEPSMAECGAANEVRSSATLDAPVRSGRAVCVLSLPSAQLKPVLAPAFGRTHRAGDARFFGGRHWTRTSDLLHVNCSGLCIVPLSVAAYWFPWVL